ncbi:DNA methylase incomplete domain protein [Mollivirus kamchatka]|nr:DNA methylase incomplete domain protein [Mollivirus kamchatka]
MEDSRLDMIRDVLGRPYYEQDNCLIYNIDCVEAMDRLAVHKDTGGGSGLFDLAVTSPPYNIGKEYEVVKPLDEYLDWCGRWLGQIHTLTKPRGALWLNVGYVAVPSKGRAVPLPYLLYDRVPFFLVQEVVWHYGAGVACRKQFSPRNEKFLWYVKDETDYVFNLDDVRDPNVKYPNQRKNGVLRCNPKGRILRTCGTCQRSRRAPRDPRPNAHHTRRSSPRRSSSEPSRPRRVPATSSSTLSWARGPRPKLLSRQDAQWSGSRSTRATATSLLAVCKTTASPLPKTWALPLVPYQTQVAQGRGKGD